MRQRLLLLLIVALPILIADQGTKAMVADRYEAVPTGELARGEDGASRILIDGLLTIRPAPNSALEEATSTLLPAGVMRPLVLGAGLLALVFLVWLTLARRALPPGVVVGLSALIGGASGNLMDRLVRGHVLDWLQWHGPGGQGAAFTVGDLGIWSGVALLLVELVRPHHAHLAQPAPPALPGV